MVRNTGDSVRIEYQNGDLIIRFRCYLAVEGLVTSVDNEHTTESKVSKNGTEYTVYFNENSGRRSITWFSSDGTLFHDLDGFCATEELIKIAENLS